MIEYVSIDAAIAISQTGKVRPALTQNCNNKIVEYLKIQNNLTKESTIPPKLEEWVVPTNSTISNQSRREKNMEIFDIEISQSLQVLHSFLDSNPTILPNQDLFASLESKLSRVLR